MPARPGRRIGPAAALLAGLLAGAPAARAQQAQSPDEVARAARLNQQSAFSLFLLTNTGFTAGGYANYDDSAASADFTVYSLPLRERFDTSLGPIELRLTLGAGRAVTNTYFTLPGQANALAADRYLLDTWSGRIDIGRPITLLPGLEFTPLLGLGYSSWTGKLTQRQAGAAPVPDSRIDFWTDAVIYEVTGILEYRHRWRQLEIIPGIAVNYAHISSFDGRANLTLPGVEGGRAKVGINGNSTLLRAALRVEGPLGINLAGLALSWQGFVAGAYEASQQSLFPWAVEIGGALGADLGPPGRRIGLNPGTLFLGAGYIVGENLQGFRVNFGFRF